MPPRNDVSRGGRGRASVWLTALLSGVLGALLVLALMPWGFGVNPIDLVRGKLRTVEVTTKSPERDVNIEVISPSEGGTSITEIARAVSPSIVNIDIRTAPQSSPLFDIGAQEGTGSGVIYTNDGYIITNNHVVEGAQDITVTLASGEELNGKNIGADPENDIAVVKIDKSDLPVLTLGDSDKLVVGQLCAAFGSPFGFEQTVTSGIVSALNRSISAGSQSGGQTTVLTNLIQTDAAINPGNSGGALTDGRGRLIGINAVIATASGGSEGVGFAIPINTASKVAEDIISGKPISHPYIGVLGQTVSESIAEQYNLPVNKGAYVTRVVPQGPADKAGIKVGHIIVAIDGKPVKSMDEVVAEVRSRSVGDTIELTYYSGSDRKKAEVKLEERPKNL
jgi:S1-C subfamily serine protease